MSNVPDDAMHQGYDLRLAVKCRRIEPRFRFEGIIVGESLKISSKHLLFTTTEALLPGQVVEACIDWPIRLDDRVHITLVVEGKVITSADDSSAMRIDRYQFRTRGSVAQRYWGGDS
jgi:hypothetical protein